MLQPGDRVYILFYNRIGTLRHTVRDFADHIAAQVVLDEAITMGEIEFKNLHVPLAWVTPLNSKIVWEV